MKILRLGFIIKKKNNFEVQYVTTENSKEEEELFFSLDVPRYWHSPLLIVSPPGNISNLKLLEILTTG